MRVERRRIVRSAMRRNRKRRSGSHACARPRGLATGGAGRAGFTLVELLVSAGLVVLMLLMFATIFQIATASLGVQRGIAENDQRARTLTTILHNDFENRTFKSVVAFAAGEQEPVPGAPDASIRDFGKRRGYLYISENDPDDDRDDVLAFTVELEREAGRFPLFGRAGHLFFEDSNNNGRFDAGEHIYQNQPELDGDGDYTNRTGILTAAEVCYFVRGGNLYRRVMLIRRGQGGDEQPQMESGVELFDPNLPPSGGSGLPRRYSGRFYRDFDYSVYAIDATDQNGDPVLKVKFHGDDSLENAPPAIGGSSFFSLGDPHYRFGHHYLTGQPREYVNAPNGTPNVQFIGRFIHEETSHNTFRYPFDLNAGNPLSRNRNEPGYLTLMTDDNGGNPDGVVDRYEGGPRRSEDILMTHVHGFDVKVWDDRVGRWRDVGWRDDPSQGIIGDYGQFQNQHVNPPSGLSPIIYGPKDDRNPIRNRVFDTWNPEVDINGTQNDPRPDGADRPPFRPTRNFGGMPGDEVPVPMRALQITVRYYDVSSDQNRTLTLEFSLLD